MKRKPSMDLLQAIALAFAVAVVVGWAVAATETDAHEMQIRQETPRGKAPSLYASDLEAPTTLGVGRIARDVARHLPSLEAVSAWLTRGASELGFDKVRPVIARDNEEMVDFLRRGIVDVVSETPLSAIHFVEDAGATIILREKRRGESEYSAIILVREDSPIRSIADLAGRRMACEDPGSTTAFLLPVAAIKQAGLKAEEIDDATSPPAEGTVSYFFTRSESSILTAVSRGVADAGAMSDEDWKGFQREKPGPASNLRVLWQSEPVPRAFVLTGPKIEPKQRDGIRELLLTMANDRKGLDALEKYNDVDGFDPIGATLEREIETLGKTYALVREEMR